MTPEQLQQFNQLVSDIKELKISLSNNAYENLINELIKTKTTQDERSTETGDITRTTSIGDSGGTVLGFDFPDEWLQLRYKGELIRIPVYKESRFV